MLRHRPRATGSDSMLWRKRALVRQKRDHGYLLPIQNNGIDRGAHLQTKDMKTGEVK